MTNEQKQVRDWMQAFGQECLEKPTIPPLEVRKLRAKIILEEALETCHALNMNPFIKRNLWEDDMLEIDDIGFWEDSRGDISLEDIADGCEDLKVVTEGTLIACGLVKETTVEVIYESQATGRVESVDEFESIDPLFDEVMRSNWSKMWNETDITLENDKPEYNFVKISLQGYLCKDEDGKVIKSPSYSPSNLAPIIEAMSKESSQT